MRFNSFFIGPNLVEPPLVMAPLHDITDHIFRNIILNIGGIGLIYSEMISSEALIRNVPKARIMMTKATACLYTIQLSGHRPDSLMRAAHIVEETGADIIDLNMGCPAHNVTNNGAGSALLKDINLAEACIKAVVQSVTLPVTIKMRTGWNDTTHWHNYLDFLYMLENSGVKAIAIHPRTRSQQYKGHADWTLIKKAVDSKISVPIIGNGDITRPEDVARMFKETGCAGVMIGRAALLNPWIFQQILNPNLVITELQKINLCKEVFTSLSTSLPPIEAVHKIKKLGSWLTKGIKNGITFRSKLSSCNSTELLITEIEKLQDSCLSEGKFI